MLYGTWLTRMARQLVALAFALIYMKAVRMVNEKECAAETAPEQPAQKAPRRPSLRMKFCLNSYFVLFFAASGGQACPSEVSWGKNGRRQRKHADGI